MNNQEKSEEILAYALQNVPFYRDHWRSYDINGHSVDERYRALPVLTKADMRSCFPDGLVPVGTDVKKGLHDDVIEYTFTSGTTGEKVVNLWNQGWWHASEMASWKLNPNLEKLSYPPKQATLASSLNVGISCEEDLPMDHRIMGDLLYLNEKANILCWKDSHLQRMARELNEYRPDVLEANPSLLGRCCWYWLDHGIEVHSPKVITFTYELPSKVSLSAITQVFHCPIVSSYGTTETGFVMDSGLDGRYRQNEEYCRIDFVPLKGKERLGRIFVTTFGNPWAYIIRFDVGDLVVMDPDGTVGSIEGRVSNLTFTTKGEVVTTSMVDEAMSLVPGIRDYDVLQKAKDAYEVRIVASEGASSVRKAERMVEGLYGKDGVYDVAAVDDLLPGPSGKYRRTHVGFPFDEWTLTQEEVKHA